MSNERTGSPCAKATFLQAARRQIKMIDRWLDEAIGPDFNTAFYATGCELVIDTALETPAYVPFHHDDGFINCIFMNGLAGPDMAGIYSNIFHERVHAIDYFNTPVLHADLFGRNDVVLCPSDMLWLYELLERNAYTKAGPINRHASRKKNDDIKSALCPFYLMEQDSPRFQILSPQARLKRAGDAVMRSASHIDAAITRKEFYDSSYAMQALEHISQYPDVRQRQFVRLDPGDIVALGNTFGVNPFSADRQTLLPAYRRPFPLSPHCRALVALIDAELGITDESSLPTFGEAVGDKLSFLQESRMNMHDRGLPAVAALLHGPSP